MRHLGNTAILETLLLGILLGLAGCAGPSTPFGALSDLFPPSKESMDLEAAEASEKQGPQPFFKSDKLLIQFQPSRQNLHSRQTFKVKIRDEQGIPLEHYQLKLKYDGLDVTPRFLKQSRIDISQDERELVLSFSGLALDPLKANQIEVHYTRYPNEDPVIVNYLPPVCRIAENNRIKNTGRFDPPPEWINLIEQLAKKDKINPSLVAGLIAQESSFNPKALSWAKALGLTQVTPIADREIASVHTEWPRSDKIVSASYPELKLLLMTDKLSPTQDWRLDPQLSIRGGVTYLKYVRSYWDQPLQRKLLRQLFGNDIPLGRIYLASYNSGPSRVAQALRSDGRRFLNSASLREAKRYVNRVTSYCYHFAMQDIPEVSDEDPS